MWAQTEFIWVLENTKWMIPRGEPLGWVCRQVCGACLQLFPGIWWISVPMIPTHPQHQHHLPQLQAALQAHVVLGGNTPRKCWSHFTIPPCFEYSRFTPVFPLSNFSFPTWPVSLGNRSSDLNFLQITWVKYFYFFGEITELYQSSSSPPPKTAPQHYRQHDTPQDSFVYLQFLYHKYYFSFTYKLAYALGGFQLYVSLVKHKKEFLPSHLILLETKTMSGKHQLWEKQFF